MSRAGYPRDGRDSGEGAVSIATRYQRRLSGLLDHAATGNTDLRPHLGLLIIAVSAQQTNDLRSFRRRIAAVPVHQPPCEVLDH